MARKRHSSSLEIPAVHREESSGSQSSATLPPIQQLKNRKYCSTNTPVVDRPNEGMGVKPTHSDSSESDPKDLNEKKVEAEKGVQDAIKGLARMERRLIRATKRQKLEVQNSNVPVRRDYEDEHAFKPRPTKNVDNTMADNRPQVGKHLPAADGKILRSECEDDDSSKGDRRAADGPPVTADVAERGPARSPPVNSDYLPLPWKGRLGYACINTYLHNARPPVFSSRTCKMSSIIIDHQHPLQHSSEPEHSTNNRPDKTETVSVALGQQYFKEIGLANVRDIVKMLKWNEKYGIKFMRLSSKMFPFASHSVHGYSLEPFASDVLAAAGKVAAEFGHRLTMHPGQYTQLGSPRKEVIAASARDLAYHDELLTLLRLPPQQDRDAVIVLYMGGTYGDKAATLCRFRNNYCTLLTPSIRRRLVLENDDVGWGVHDLLPVCEELDIPLVLDWHNNNIVFDASQIREGTLDISDPEIQARIRRTWDRKGITQKMHYSEPIAGAVTVRERRKHIARVVTLPPCRPDMDLMILAKDKEQAVLELMRNFKLPGFEKASEMVPFERKDQDLPLAKGPERKKGGRGKGKGEARKKKRGNGDGDEKVKEEAGFEDEGDRRGNGQEIATTISAEEFGMGGPQNRVYWPPGMEDWLRPRKGRS